MSTRRLTSSRSIHEAPIVRLDLIGEGTTGTSHTHVNKVFLDGLDIDPSVRLTYQQHIIPVPILQEDW